MRTTEVVVRNPSGIHLRPGAVFVRTAARFTSAITIENVSKGSGTFNAKSMTDIIKAQARMGDTVRLTAEGDDEEAAVAGLAEAITAGLGEQLEA
jgi:phosphocarrier protein